MKPLISVIIPTYKRSKYITRAINSVLNQTYKNIEIIVVDDNKRNAKIGKFTKNVLKKYIKKKQIKFIKHNDNKGISAARNTGIKKSKGEFIAFLVDYDEFLPKKIKLQLDIFKKLKNKIGLVYGAYQEINVDNGKKKIILPKYKNNVYDILGINHIGTPSMVMCSRLAIKKIGGFDVNLNHKEDIDFYFRLSKYFDVSYTSEVLIKYYIHSGSASKNDSDRLVKMLRFLKKHQLHLKRPRIRWSELQERLGKLYFLNDKKKKAFKSLCLAYINRPLRLIILIKIFFLLLNKKF